jgi:hypothetical protein
MSKTTLKPWVWYGLAGHLCVGHKCRFHLCTKVNGFLVSTVGDYYDPENKRETIGSGDEDWFETMVFKAGQPCKLPDCGCGLPEINGSGLDCFRYTTAGDAQLGHLRFCRKYDRRASATTTGKTRKP